MDQNQRKEDAEQQTENATQADINRPSGCDRKNRRAT